MFLSIQNTCPYFDILKIIYRSNGLPTNYRYLCTMNIAILIESQYAGCARYWNKLLQSEQIVIDRHEHFVRRSYRNRTNILGANGLLRLSIPLESGKSQHAAMKDVRISYAENWQKLHWQSMNSAYRRSPFFEFYEDQLVRFYEQRRDFLIDFNQEMQQVIANILKVTLPIEFSTQYFAKGNFPGTDLRSTLLPGMEVLGLPPYSQVFGDRFPFVPDLSVLDVLFNLGPGSRDYLLSLA